MISKIIPGYCNILILTPQGPPHPSPQEPRWSKIDVRVIIWGILMHGQLLYNFCCCIRLNAEKMAYWN